MVLSSQAENVDGYVSTKFHHAPQQRPLDALIGTLVPFSFPTFL